MLLWKTCFNHRSWYRCYGRIECGNQPGDDVEIIGMQEKSLKSTVTGVENVPCTFDRGEAVDNVDRCCVVSKRTISVVVTVANPVQSPHTITKVEIYVQERRSVVVTPSNNKYRPQFYLRN